MTNFGNDFYLEIKHLKEFFNTHTHKKDVITVIFKTYFMKH